MGKSKQISLPDHNHNIKNTCYQLVGGSGAIPLVIGNYAVTMARGMPKELGIVDHFASDALVLHLTSPPAMESILVLNIAYVGNK